MYQKITEEISHITQGSLGGTTSLTEDQAVGRPLDGGTLNQINAHGLITDFS